MPAPGASNINFAQGTRTPLNLAPEPGGALVKAPSQALIPTNQPGSLPQINPQSFAEPPRPSVNFTNPNPLPNLRDLKPPSNPIPETLPNPRSPNIKLPSLNDLPKIPPEVKAGVAVGSTLINPATAANPIVPLKLGHAAVQIWAHNAHELMKLWQLSQPESTPNDLVLEEEEGQIPNVRYGISYTVYVANQPPSTFEQTTEIYLVVWGEYKGHRYFDNPETGRIELQFLCRGKFGNGSNPYTGSTLPSPELIWVFGNASWNHNQIKKTTINSIQQLDNNNQPISKPPQPQPQPQRVPSLSPQPINVSPNQPKPQPQLNNFPEKPPFAEPETKKPPIKFAVPSGQPIQISSPGQPAIQIAPAPTSQPNKQPTIISIPTNTPTGQRQPVQVTTPGGSPTTFTSTGGAPVTINIPGFKPINYTPGQGQPENTIRPIQQPDILVPESIPQPAIPIQKIKPIGDSPAGLQVESRPKVQPTPETTGTNSKGQPVIFTPTAPVTPTAPTPTTQPTPTTEDPAKGFIPTPDPATIVLTGITPFLQKLIEQTSQPAIANAVCSTTQPGGCTSNLVNNAANNTNKKIDGLGIANLAGQLGDLALLKIIDAKLGAQVPGGISGFLSRFAKSIHLDKILNALTLIAVLHNAAMLSRNLASTLGEVTSQALSVIGLKDENDSPIDINAILGKQINNLFETLLGAETWRGAKTAWNKANTIISSATQIVYTVRSLWDSSKEILEWTAENTGKIGNALKRFRVVGENAFKWMPERVTHQNAWALKIDRFRQGTDNLDDAASSLQGVLGEVQSIQEEFKELNEQKEKFDKNIADLIPKDRAENKPVAAAVAASKEASKAPSNAADVFRGEGETPNA